MVQDMKGKVQSALTKQRVCLLKDQIKCTGADPAAMATFTVLLWSLLGVNIIISATAKDGKKAFVTTYK